jgi:hypothetical protein
MFLKNLSIADDGPGTPASVKVAAGIDPTVVVAINAGRVSGPATLIGSSYPADGLSMGAHHQVGIGAGGSSGANRFAGALSTTRFPVKPLVAQSFYLTRGYPPTSANTVTVSETDGPVGLTAYRLTSSLAPFNRDVLNVAAIDSAATVAVGDMYVMGCWVRAPDGIDLSHPDAPVLYFGFNGADAVLDGANYYVVKAPTSDGSWSWVSVATKVTAITNNPPGPMRLLALMYPNFRLDIFQPTVYRFATGTYDESDILDWIQSIVPMPASATAGNAVLLPGQNLEFGKNQSAVGPQITYASAIPTSGTWAAGSLAFHSAPIFLQPRGWVCTASGTPGQWSGMEPLPLPIPTTGLKLWLRADLGVTLSDGFVSQWSDFSGNSNDVANATGGQQPTVTASSINGLPAITWPGNSTVFLHNTVTNLVSSNAARTVIAIIKPGANSYAWLFTFRRAAPVFAIGWNNAFGFHWVYRDNQGANYEIVPNGPTPGTAYMLEFGYDGLGGDITFTHNTTTEIVTDGGAGVLSDTGTTGFTVGANETAAGSTTFSGDVAEIIAYDHVITAAERLALRIYVQARYGIPLGV